MSAAGSGMALGQTDAGSAETLPQSAKKQAAEQITRAVARLEEDDADGARTALLKAVEIDPRLPLPTVMLARLYFVRGEVARGRRALEEAVTAAPDRPEPYLTLGRLALRERRVTEAGLLYEKAGTLPAPRGWSERRKGELKVTVHSGIAAAAELRGDWAKAETHLRIVLEEKSFLAPARSRLATALFFQGRPDETFAELERAARVVTGLPRPEVAMARLHSSAGNAETAREWLERGMKKHPRAAGPRVAMANYLLARGKFEPATPFVEEALRVEPRDAEARLLAAVLTRRRGEFAEAEQLLEKLYGEGRRRDVRVVREYVLTLASSDVRAKVDKAVEVGEAFAKRYPDAAEAAGVLGWAYYQANRMEDAERTLQRAVRGGVASSDTLYFLAKVFEATNRKDAARRALRGAVDAGGYFFYREEAEAMLAALPKG